MKVSELIKELQKYPPDLPVVLEPDIEYVQSISACELAEEIVEGREKDLVLTKADATEVDKDSELYEFIVPQDLEDEERVLHKYSKKRECLIISSEYFEFSDGGIGEITAGDERDEG